MATGEKIGSTEEQSRNLARLINLITESEVFRNAPTTRRLLTFLVDHRGESISEYAIATEALGRRSDFDPKTDASVRVQIARLRAKLAEFYAREGKGFPLQLSIPVGGHELEWAFSSGDLPSALPPSATPPKYRNAFLAAVILMVILVACLLISLSQYRSLKASVPTAASMPRFWHAFLVNGKSTVIVLPNLTAFRWANKGVYIMDPSAEEFEKWKTSPLLSSIGERWGPPTLNQTFVFGRDVFATLELHEYLEKFGQPIQMIEDPNYAAESSATQNTIFLGRPGSSAYIRQFSKKMNFDLARGIPSLVVNRNPRTGEPTQFEEVELSSKRRICPGIIALLPKRPEGTRNLVLIGRWTTAISSMLVSTDGLKLLDEIWTKAGSPSAWEMVVQAEIESDTTIVKVWPVAFREIEAGYWN